MESNFDDTDGMPFTPLERFVMELLRVITPNRGSLSRIGEIGTSRHESRAYLLSPHTVTNLDQIHWKDHEKFNPDRYNTVPTSNQIDERACEQIGFVRCPFERATFDVRDGRNGHLTKPICLQAPSSIWSLVGTVLSRSGLNFS